MMRQILTNETARRIIDFVSPIYGNSYVGLWIYQAIGIVLGEVYNIADQMQYEITPATSELLLDYWEDHYKIPRDVNLTVQQRQQRILSMLVSRGGCTPSRMAAAISAALNGVEVDIEENVAKNTFRIYIRKYVESIAPAVAVAERMKPAHLIYQIHVAARTVTQSEIDIAIAMTRAEMYKVEVKT
jgi:uncharacterized protein YmfQ (DUF2313 family)